MNNSSINSIDFNFIAPSTSADYDIDLTSLGITGVKNNTLLNQGNLYTTDSIHRSNVVPAKRKSPKIDAVSITDYCLRRLAEIKRINELSHTPSAYSCLMSFIGFLATLVYENERYEVDTYTKFVHEYIKEMYCARVVEKKTGVQSRVSGHNKNNSWGEVIYSLVRCGLVHNMNVTGKKNNNQEQIRVVLTHVPFQGKDCKVYKFGSYDKARLVVDNDEFVVLVINAFDLCDAVQKAIIRMFQKSRVRASASHVLKQHSIVRQIS